MKSRNFAICLLLLVVCCETNATETRPCPSYCTCDLFENFNRADCSGQRIISPNVELPFSVEVLDLSYNDITTLDNACFEGLIYLVNLIIAYNALHTIYLDAFTPLKEITSIDLSYNRLEYFDERIFETNTKLTRLDLSGNKFMSLNNKPMIVSKSLQYLGLHDARVTYIYPLLFTETPALQELDISGNLMITMTSSSFKFLPRLKSVKLEDNRWNCDKSLEVTIKYLKARNVNTTLTSCAFDSKTDRASGNGPMFEKMMEAPPVQIKLPTSVDSVWKPKRFGEEATCYGFGISKLCQLHRECLTRLETVHKNEEGGVYSHQYSVDDFRFAFFAGIFVGITVIICCSVCIICIKNFCCNRQKMRPDPACRQPIPPPVPPRQRQPNRRQRNAPPMNRSLSQTTRSVAQSESNPGGFPGFLSLLFERPTRRRYRRTINENTAYMIRRLSQSNLFNNRLSQHFTGNRGNNSENVQHNEPLIHTPAQEGAPARSPGERWQSAAAQVIQVNANATAPSVRPETPPPSYGDAVKPYTCS